MAAKSSFLPLGRRSWLVRAKLQAPRQPMNSIARPDLLDALDAARDHGMGLILAPAGFGKTTLLTQWRQRLVAQDVRVAWLTLDEADADARPFLSYVVRAISSAGVQVGRLEMLAEQGLMDTAPKLALLALLECVAEAGGPLVLVLEDYQRAQCDDIDKLVAYMVAASPPEFCLIINSRVRPNINLPHLLASGAAAELDAGRLRFTFAEAALVLEGAVSDAVLQELYEKTEGWPAALQLAALVSQSADGADQMVARCRGHQGHIATYLTEQVFATLSDENQQFLIRTSIVERFSAQLANVLCGRSDSWEVLRNLDRLHGLLVPTDDDQTSFRYHHLFSDYLRNALSAGFPTLPKELHLRASLWFEEQGNISDAVRHAGLAEDLERTASLIEMAGGWELILYGGIEYLRNLLRHVPRRELRRFPRLQLATSYLCMKEGSVQEARALFEQVHAGHPAPVAGSALSRDIVNMQMMLDCYEDRPVSEDVVAEVVLRAEAWPQEDSLTRGMFSCRLALANLALGRFGDAEALGKAAMQSMRRADSMLGLNYCYLHAGVAAFYGARLDASETYLREAREMAEDNFGEDSGLRFIADVLIGGVRFWRGDLHGPKRSVFLGALDYVEQFDGWFEIYAMGLGVAVELALADNDVPEVERIIAKSRRIATARGLQRLDDLAAIFQIKVDCRLGKKRSFAETMACFNNRFDAGNWRRDRFLWRAYLELAEAVSRGAADGGEAQLDDAIECARHIGASLHLIRLLTTRASLAGKHREPGAAAVDVLEALRLAAGNRIRAPFRTGEFPALALKAAVGLARVQGDDLLVTFVDDVLRVTLVDAVDRHLGAFGLSPRELDVLMELKSGQSNKQIARALRMSENTVKFHLKSVFSKFGVDSRAQLIASLSAR